MDVFDVETAAARSARLMQIANKGWIAWIGRASLGIRDMTEAGWDLAGCRSTADLLKLQRSWVETAAERGAADLRDALELMRAMAGVTVDAGKPFDGAAPAGSSGTAPVPVVPSAARAPEAPMPEAFDGVFPEAGAGPGAPATAEPEPEPVSGGEPAKVARPARRKARSAGTASRRGR